MVSEQSATPDLVELTRRCFAAANRRDWDEMMGFFARDAVWEAQELQAFEGRIAIRGLIEDWLGVYEGVEIEAQDVVDLGRGVACVAGSLEGQIAHSTAHMRVRFGAVFRWANDLIVRVTSYADGDEARAAAERLAEGRG